MRRLVSIFLCLALCIGMCFSFTSCGKEDEVYELGPYVIREDEYRYLLGVYRRQIGIALGYDQRDWNSKNENGMTIGQYIDSAYTTQFQATVYMLLYSQAVFDDEGLSLTPEEENMVEANVKMVLAYISNYSEEDFDYMAKENGFTTETLRSIYKMQIKQQKVQDHLFGKTGEKITDSTVEKYYEDNFIRFQTLVINNSYKIVENKETGKTEIIALNEAEKKEKNDLIDDLTNLFAADGEKKEDYEYKVIDPTLSYEQLWAKYSDDIYYPNGCYMMKPSLAQMAASPALTAASILKNNEIARVEAQRYFQTAIPDANISAGDSVKYGYVFVKRLPLDEKGYSKEENKDFFGNEFKSTMVNTLFAERIADYVKTSAFYELKENTEIINSYSISTITPNYLDYELMLQLESKAEESDK